jgi:hypothetical protein
MKIKITEFGGMAPGIAAHLLPVNGAQEAENVYFDKGDLRAWKKPYTVSSLTSTYDATVQYLAADAKRVVYNDRLYYCTTDTPSPAGAWDISKWSLLPIQSLFRIEENSNEHWIVSDKDRDYVRSFNSSDIYERVYFSGEAEAWVYCNDLVSSPFDPWGDYYKLGVSAPAAACVVDTYTNGGAEYYAWFYTFVNKYGEEGAPSAIIDVTDYLSGNVDLGGFTAPPSGRALENGKIRLYRTSSSSAGVAEFQFVSDTNINGFTFATDKITDTMADISANEVCPSETWDVPPDNLQGLTLFKSNIVVGFVDNKVCFSTPGFPHAWPEENRYPIASNIVGLAVYGAIVYIMTDDFYYFFFGDDPSDMSKDNSETMYPCQSKRSIFAFKNGVGFAGNEGLMVVNAGGCVNITQGDVYGVQDWIGMNPATMHGTYYNGKYFFFYTDVDGDRHGELLDLANGKKLTSLSMYAFAGYSDYGGGKFYMILTGDNYYNSDAAVTVKEWNADPYNYLRRLWKSRQIFLPNKMFFKAARVFIDTNYYQEVLALAEEASYTETLNAPIFAAGTVLGEINSGNICEYEINGDTLYSPSAVSTNANADIEIYLDGTLVHAESIATNDIFPVSASAKGSVLEIVVSGYVPIHTIEIAGSVQELITT